MTMRIPGSRIAATYAASAAKSVLSIATASVAAAAGFFVQASDPSPGEIVGDPEADQIASMTSPPLLNARKQLYRPILVCSLEDSYIPAWTDPEAVAFADGIEIDHIVKTPFQTRRTHSAPPKDSQRDIPSLSHSHLAGSSNSGVATGQQRVSFWNTTGVSDLREMETYFNSYCNGTLRPGCSVAVSAAATKILKSQDKLSRESRTITKRRLSPLGLPPSSKRHRFAQDARSGGGSGDVECFMKCLKSNVAAAAAELGSIRSGRQDVRQATFLKPPSPVPHRLRKGKTSKTRRDRRHKFSSSFFGVQAGSHIRSGGRIAKKPGHSMYLSLFVGGPEGLFKKSLEVQYKASLNRIAEGESNVTGSLKVGIPSWQFSSAKPTVSL
jgi:hypothetical protein